MNFESDSIKKIVYLYDVSSGATKQIVATISLPYPFRDVEGDHYCYASIDEIFPARRKIRGVDPLQAIFLATEFVDWLLTAQHHGFEIRNADGSKYVSTLGR